MLALTGCGSSQKQAFQDLDPVAAIVEMLRGDSPTLMARDALNTYDADKRRDAVVRLSMQDFGGDEPFVRLYRLLLDDPDPTVRAAAAMALGEHGQVSDGPLLARMLEDDAAYARWEAAKALQKVHHPAAIKALTQAVTSDEDDDVRMAAATALGQYADPAVFQTLVAALDDRVYGVTRAANKSLCTLTGQDLEPIAARWLAFERERGAALFADQRPYRYQIYEAPARWLDNITFWRGRPEQAEARSPRGLNEARDSQVGGE